jgi:phospholipid/cholesterol/gamma-HCH transport system substrate-binding protein
MATNDSLYNNLVSASDNLSLLLKDMNEHPKRYVHFSVFGKKDKKQ